jgi:CheY-like chemotaxis protein
MEQKTISVLLVYNRPDPLNELRWVLESQGVKTLLARSCGEATLCLWGERAPLLVFTDIQLGDGTWADIIVAASKAPAA